ncbi:hypothetical protein AKO1_003405 [Acrasis kona]|uniref:Uncharacterized protein n=1 Tax=Acrasis kona TaxID=1008807 RepID=A0AAW2ZMJ3_9EUKA
MLAHNAGQKVVEYKAKKSLKGIKKYCSYAFEGILYVAVLISLVLILVGGILDLVPTNIVLLDYPIGQFMNLPIGIYAVVYVLLFVWPVIPFPIAQRKLPVFNYFHKNFLVRGVVLGVPATGLALTLATAFGAALMLLCCVSYIIVYFIGFQPAWTIEPSSNEYKLIDEDGRSTSLVSCNEEVEEI